MARTGVNYEQVKAVADQLRSAGEEPTIEKVRGVLNTGSNTTISNYLKQWRYEHDGNGTESATLIQQNSDLPLVIQKAMGELWKTAASEAGTKFSEERKQLLADKENSDNKAKEACLERDRVSGSLEKLEHEYSSLMESFKQSQSHMQAIQSQLGDKERQITQLTQGNKELQDQLRLLLEKQGEQEKNHNAELKEERRRSEDQESHWMNVLDQNRQEWKLLQKNYESRLLKTGQEIDECKNEIKRLVFMESEIEKVKKELLQYQSEKASLEKDLEDIEKNYLMLLWLLSYVGND